MPLWRWSSNRFLRFQRFVLLSRTQRSKPVPCDRRTAGGCGKEQHGNPKLSGTLFISTKQLPIFFRNACPDQPVGIQQPGCPTRGLYEGMILFECIAFPTE